MMPRIVAALYIDPRGPYPKMPDVECWTVTQRQGGFWRHDDAGDYRGPHTVVAHPPCGPWGGLRHLHEDDTARRFALDAVEQVQAWGGVLEHPAGSKLWDAAQLPRPGAPADNAGGYTVAVEQVKWGHVARKRTWLYLVGVPREALEAPPMPGREPTHWVSGSRATPGRKRPAGPGDVPPGVMVCSEQQRNRTPEPFAAYLVRLARASRGGWANCKLTAIASLDPFRTVTA